jgi:dephospho-CoA kinase
VTGQPGAGKSSVVARAARHLEAAGIRDGLFLHARSGTQAELLDAARELIGDETITDTEAWKEHLGRPAGFTGAGRPVARRAGSLSGWAWSRLTEL